MDIQSCAVLNFSVILGRTLKVFLFTQLRVVDPVTGVDQGPNKEGEIWIRGPTVMKGYLGNPGATAATIGQSMIDSTRQIHLHISVT
jgi:acyl-CoA synthetase (AMP-forming)/AMP-acid ligase II